MTTMFVQLRGVVYLLVLLHCCMCARGDTVESVAGAGGQLASNAQSVENPVEEVLLNTSDAERVLLEGEAILSVLKKEVSSCNQTYSRRAGAVDEFAVFQNDMQMYTNTKDDGKIEPEKGVDGKEFRDFLHKVKMALNKKNTAPYALQKPIDNVESAKTLCQKALDEVKVVLNNLNTTAELDERGTKIREKLTKLQSDIDSELKRCEKAVFEARDLLKTWKSVMDTFSGIATALTAKGAIMVRDGTNVENNLKNIKQLSEEKLKEIEDFKKENENKRMEQATKEIEEKVKEAKKTVMERIAEQRRAEEEAKQVPNEEAGNVQGAAERVVEKEKVKEPTEKNRDEKDREEEEQKPVKGEESTRPAEAEKNKEDKAREAEKVRETMEVAERTNITIRWSDGSSSPALVHSPLLLLVLMCVLGCTLVC
ncbi:uncharacterized protein TM35_000082210 [Trypanosoma theileri]|uniref:Mucin-associated surface protein (MASP) n=1 Tax=Trypanosoma theileri TaxID=67003 RepID=A0A1X0P142_9TRYP|nr:uncharacterized protein TM35_000082210 [Trypanosoma theileri]ORC90423.1 hypothetical protein TM35_000082210 [Trypanosoma theileri]